MCGPLQRPKTAGLLQGCSWEGVQAEDGGKVKRGPKVKVAGLRRELGSASWSALSEGFRKFIQAVVRALILNTRVGGGKPSYEVATITLYFGTQITDSPNPLWLPYGAAPDCLKKIPHQPHAAQKLFLKWPIFTNRRTFKSFLVLTLVVLLRKSTLYCNRCEPLIVRLWLV